MQEFMDLFKQVWQVIVESKLLNVIGAIAILLIGWFIALWASRRISDAVHALSAKRTVSADGKVVPPEVDHADTVVGKTVFYIIMIFAVLSCFSILELNEAAAPLKEFISQVLTYLPNVLGALVLIVIARIVAGIVRAATRAALIRSKLNERLAAQVGMKESESMADYTATTLYYLVFLFFLPAVLNVLKIEGITKPLEAMFQRILVFLPHLVLAAAVLVIGLWAANLIRRVVSGLVVISRLNAFGEKLGVSKVFGNGGLASMAGIAAYALVAIPVVISALTALQIEALTNSVSGFFNKMLDATGDMIGAGLIIFIAVLLGGFVSSLVAQLMANFGLDKFAEDLGFKRSGENVTQPSVLVGKLAFTVIMVLALLAACDAMEFTALSNLIREFAAFGGNVLLSIVVLFIGIWLANFAASAVKGRCSDILTAAVRVTVIVFTAAVAVGNMNIGGTIVEIAFSLILGAVCVAAAIAFGIGGREAAAKLLKNWTDKLEK